ncbi:uncharacterized protein LOC135388756 [Ornithodoros turicata]|uniref:uncharacterized protein LOC135388756 n=1 Tax=Ornithodoros turicata TaxID=34597 RepID=UPI003139E8C6
MLLGLLLVAASAPLVWTKAPTTSSLKVNLFVDNVLRSSLLPPATPLQDFEFKVKKTGMTNRQLKAKFRNGALRQGSSRVARDEDCGDPVWMGGNITVVCSVSLGPVNATYDAEIKGDTLFGKTKKEVRALGVIPATKAKFEATVRPGYPLYVKGIYFDSLDVESDFSKKVNLNAERLQHLKDGFEKRVLSQVYNVLYSHYVMLLKGMLQSAPFPAF